MKQKRIPFKERIRQALMLHKQGNGIEPVAKILQVSRTQAYKILQEYGSQAEFVRVEPPTRGEIKNAVAEINKQWSANDRKVRWVGQYARG
jgi:transposase